MAFLLYHSLEWVLPKDSSDCLRGDWTGDDGIDVFGGLNSIRSLSSGNLSDDRLLRVSRKLRRISRGRDKSIRKDIIEYPGCSRSSNTSFGGNLVNRKTIGGKGEDTFLLSRGDGVHCGIVEFWKYWSWLNSLTQGPMTHNITIVTICWQLVAIAIVEHQILIL